MGIIAKQAFRNSVSIIIGTLAGAANTLVVLPRAFNDEPEKWGLIAVLMGWAMIMTQVFSLGTPNLLIRYLPKLEDKKALQGFAGVIALIGWGLLAAVLFTVGPELIGLVNAEDAQILEDSWLELFVLTSALLLFTFINGFLSSVLKTTIIQFQQEVVLKSSYLLIAVAYWVELYSFEVFLWLLVGSYILVSLIQLVYGLSQGFRLHFNWMKLPKKPLMSYSMYSLLDKGANLIVQKMDILMIGALIGLEHAAFYTLAFYIGAVTQLPQKSIMAIANPVASRSIAENDPDNLQRVYEQSSRLQLLIGGFIFCGVWVSLPELMTFFPEKFQGAYAVVFFIGISKLVYMATGVSGGIIIYSKHYKKNLILNAGLIAFTFLTNYFFISEQYLNMGITGAALATAITLFIYNLSKVVLIKKYFKMSPYNLKFVGIILTIALGVCLVFCSNHGP
ncbi:MAG: oligosaccharide flippase family protein [Flavobacteriales bacterium]|nr:oligosaccharide flippase family protein [Flavobacteriales bacterium]